MVNHSSYAEVIKRLPNASFENGTEAIGYARYVKTDEQIASCGAARRSPRQASIR